MLCNIMDKYGDDGKIFCNYLNSKNISHAYLIDENNNDESFDMVLSFVKGIICECSFDNLSILDKENICRRIDDNNYPEFKIIESDGVFIKKQQIIDLQQELSKKSIEGRKRVYIIKDSDKMRPEAANSLLKFLEEPDNDIIAILMTNNYNKMLPTIISRCQVIKLKNHKYLDYVVDDDDKKLIDFIYNVFNKKNKAFLDSKELWFDNFKDKDREYYCGLFDKMIDIYYDIIKVKVGFNEIKYSEYLSIFVAIASERKLVYFLNIINYLVKVKDSIKCNININLLIDSLIINVGGLLC